MKILQVTPLYYPSLGGVQLHVQAISEDLTMLGHEVVVATVAHDRSLPRIDLLAGVEIRRFPAVGPQAYHVPIGLYRYLKQNGADFDVVHAHNYGGLPLLLAVLACCERTIITPHYHGQGYSRIANNLHHIYDPLATNFLENINGIVCDSSGEARMVAQKLGIPLDSIKVIPTVISFPKGITTVEKQQNIDNQGDICLLLSVGRLVAYKRIDRIITALPYLPNNFILAIIGAGPEKLKLESLARSMNVQDRIWFLGRVSEEDLNIWYLRTKVVITLSEGEAFGRIVIEALASYCQVVCSDIFAFQDFAKEFPELISLISSEFTGEEIAKVLLEVTTRPLNKTIDLQRYARQRIINDLLRVYTDVEERTNHLQTTALNAEQIN